MEQHNKLNHTFTPSGNEEILLVDPPFGCITSPYISIPVLAAYLRSRDISVRVCDAKQEFWYRFLTPARLLEGITTAEHQFLRLNSQEQLNFTQLTEYFQCIQTLSEARAYSAEIAKTGEIGFPAIQDSDALHTFISLAMLPYYPDCYLTRPIDKLCTSFDEFSSQDIIASLKKRFFFSDILEEILNPYLESGPTVVGISVVYKTQVLPAFHCSSFIKRKYPNIHVTMGGPFISLHMRNLSNPDLFRHVDSFILDEGEVPLEKLIREKRRKTPDYSNVPGMIWHNGDNSVFNPPETPPGMEELPGPDFSRYILDRYLKSRKSISLPIRLSRGCSWQRCTFCRTGISICSNYSQPSPQYLYEQIKAVVEQTGIHQLFFSDESADPEILEALSKQFLDHDLQIQWMAHTRFDRKLNRERLALFKKAGCTHLYLGLESFNDRLLRLMKKGINRDLIQEVLSELKGILPLRVYMMIGFPTQTQAEAIEDYQILNKALLDNQINGYSYSLFYIPYGSDISTNPGKYGIQQLHTTPDQDLLPDIHNFEGTGMSRRKAFELSIQYTNNSPEVINSNSFFHLNNQELTVQGKTVPIAFNLEVIFNAVAQYSFNFPYIPYGKWLKMGEELMPPLKQNTDPVIWLLNSYFNKKP